MMSMERAHEHDIGMKKKEEHCQPTASTSTSPQCIAWLRREA